MADVKRTVEIIFGAVDQTGSTLTGLSTNLNQFESSIGSITGPLANFTENLLLTEAAVLGLAAAYGVKAVSEASKFESAQADLAKVLSDTDPAIDTFTDSVTALSETYGVAASEILQGIANFKQAGFEAEASAELQKTALDLVIAGQVGAAEASEILISALKGMNASFEEAPRFVEAMNNVSEQFATDLGELADGMGRISPILDAMGFSFEEGIGAITPIIEVFRSGDEAANALRTGLLKLIDDSAEVTGALAALGVSQFDLNGEMRSGRDIFFDVSNAFQDLDENQKIVFTTQLVGIQRASQMVKVFDNLALQTEITNTALEETGSVQEEVNIKLATAEKQIDKFTVSWDNLARSIGGEILVQFKDVVSGATAIEQAFRDIVEAGGLDPLFDALRPQLDELAELFVGVAEALPEAFKQVNFDSLIDSFGNLRDSISGLFDGLDLTNPDDLAQALQGIIDFIGLLTNASAGAIQGLEPLIDGIQLLLEGLASTDADTQSFLGNLGGIATSVDKLLPALGFLADALQFIGGVLATLAGFRAIGGLTTLATSAEAATLASTALSTKIVALLPLLGQAGLVAAAGAGGFAIGSVLGDAVDSMISKLTGTETSLGSFIFDLVNSGDSAERSAPKIEKLGDSVAGIKAVIDPTKDAIRDFDAEVEAVANASITFGDAFADAADQIQAFGLDIDPVTGQVRNLSEAQEGAAVSAEDAANAERGFIRTVEDGVVTYSQFDGAIQKTTDTKKEAATATDELSDREKLAIENTHDLRITLLELASDERIKSMEFNAEIRVAQIEAQSKQVVAAFESITDTIDVTAQATVDLFSLLGNDNISNFDKLAITQAAKKQLELQERAIINQENLINAQIRLMDAQANALFQQTEVIITSDGLEPALEAFMFEILKKIQTTVSGDYQQFLTSV